MPSSPTLSPGQQCRPRGPSPSPRERVTDSDVTPVAREVTRARPGRRVARRRAAPTAAVCGGRRGDVHLDQGPPVLRPACGDLAPTSSSEGVPSRAQTVEADLRLRAAAGPDASGRLSGAVLGGGLSSAHVDDGRLARCRDAAWSRWRGPPRAGPSGSAVGLRVAPPRCPTSADGPRWAATVTFPPGLPQRLPPAGREPCVAAALQKSTGPGTDHVGRRLAERHAVPSPCPSSRGQVTPVSGEPPRPRGSGSPSTRSLLETRAGSHEDLV